MVPVSDVFSGDPYEAALDGRGADRPHLPGAVLGRPDTASPRAHRRARGRRDRHGIELVDKLPCAREFLSLGALASVQCREEISFADPDDVEEAASTALIGGRPAATSPNTGPQPSRCARRWERARPHRWRPARSGAASRLSWPGGFDPITPPAWAAEAASTLRNATTVEFDPLSHGVSSGQGCPAQIATAFLDDPEATLDVSCAASIAPPQFVAGESGEVVMEPFDTVLLGVPLSGLAPQGWDEVAPGSFARLETPVDPTALVLQAGQGLTRAAPRPGRRPAWLHPSRPAGRHPRGGGRSWPLYEVSIQGSPRLVTPPSWANTPRWGSSSPTPRSWASGTMSSCLLSTPSRSVSRPLGRQPTAKIDPNARYGAYTSHQHHPESDQDAVHDPGSGRRGSARHLTTACSQPEVVSPPIPTPSVCH